MKAGEIYKSDNWGDVQIVEYIDSMHVVVKFLSTGNIATKRAREIRNGNIRDNEQFKVNPYPFDNPNKGKGVLAVGSVWKTNYYGDCEILEYNSNRDVRIRFLETGNLYKVQKAALVKGLVQDKKKDADAKVVAKEQREIEKRQALREKENKRIEKMKELEKELQQADLERLRKEYLERKEKLRLLNQTVYISKRFGNYSITDFCDDRTYEITFERTGHKEFYNMKIINSGNVIDHSQASEEDILIMKKEESAAYYQANREKMLEQAKTYQKNNPEKTRLRNRNRRAKRSGAEGSYTQDDLNLILTEQGCKCAGCSIPLDESKHMDHYTPLDLGGSNWPENIQWLCPFCNNSKSNKDPLVWLAQINSPEYQARRAAALAC